jgi:predicted dehydrogenase
VIEASTALFPGWSRRIEICGEHGSAILEDDRLVRWDFREKMPGDDNALNAEAANRPGAGAGTPQISHQGHRLQIQDLVDALRAGRAPAVDGRAGRNAVTLVRAVYDSAASGVSVQIG